MLRYIGRRILIAIPTLIIVSLLVFALQKLLPGDPVLTMAGEERDPQVLAYLREKYRLDDPIPVQYFAWIGSGADRAISGSRCEPTFRCSTSSSASFP